MGTHRSLALVFLVLAACSETHSPGDDAAMAIDGAVTPMDADQGGGPRIDASVFTCDAPPIAYCRTLVAAGGPTCCGSTAPPLCRTGGGYACGAGTIEQTACGTCSTPAACVSPTDCSVVPVTCCGTCGMATSSDMIAVRHDQTSTWRDTVCGGGPFACPDCAGMQDPYLVATCDAGNCLARDLHLDALTECATDADCTLAPATCCACGDIGFGAAIAFNASRGSLAALICDPRADCPPCVPTFTGIAAHCTAGRCTVTPG